jgi:hypothetical protein
LRIRAVEALTHYFIKPVEIENLVEMMKRKLQGSIPAD